MKPDRNTIYNAVINRMVREALDHKEETFAADHSQDSDETLLLYLRQCADELKHSPWPKEIIGWKYLLERFGDWNEMLKRAQLPMPTTTNKPAAFHLVIEEKRIQKQIYRERKAQKKAKAAERQKQQSERR